MIKFSKPISTASVALLAIVAPQAHAEASSDTFDAQITIDSFCTVSTTSLNFGTTATTGSTNPILAQSTVTVACNDLSTYTISIDDGLNADGTQRRLSPDGVNFVDYQIYKDANMLSAWGSGTNGRLGVTAAGTSSDYTTYGRISSVTSGVAPGSYKDTVAVSIAF